MGSDTDSRTSSADDLIGRLLLFLAVVFHLLLLLPELRTGGIYPSDAGLHLPAIERLAQAFERGESILDCWVSEWGLGYPLWRSYQPLAHLGTLFVWLLLFKTLSIATLYGWISYLLLSGFPLCCYQGSRWMGGSRLQAGSVAAIAGLVTSRAGFGMELGSHVWLGSGLYTQLWAQCLLPLAVGRSFHALRSGKRLWLAGLLGGGVFLAHFLYGYIYVLSAVLAALTLAGRIQRLRLLGRLVVPLAITAALSAFAVLPTLLASEHLNLSAWEEPWKWRSYGHATVLSDLLSGELLDHGRLPILTLLCGLGLLAALWRFRRDRQRFVLLGFLFWLALYCGRPTWGIGLRVLGVVEGFHLHRLIGAVHFFAILLAGCALAGTIGVLSRLGSSRWPLRSRAPAPRSAGARACLLPRRPAHGGTLQRGLHRLPPPREAEARRTPPGGDAGGRVRARALLRGAEQHLGAGRRHRRRADVQLPLVPARARGRLPLSLDGARGRGDGPLRRTAPRPVPPVRDQQGGCAA
ncbi:MAG: hypothetical protein ACE5F1_01300 [Planctomycetota bacterium]